MKFGLFCGSNNCPASFSIDSEVDCLYCKLCKKNQNLLSFTYLCLIKEQRMTDFFSSGTEPTIIIQLKNHLNGLFIIINGIIKIFLIVCYRDGMLEYPAQGHGLFTFNYVMTKIDQDSSRSALSSFRFLDNEKTRS